MGEVHKNIYCHIFLAKFTKSLFQPEHVLMFYYRVFAVRWGGLKTTATVHDTKLGAPPANVARKTTKVECLWLKGAQQWSCLVTPQPPTINISIPLLFMIALCMLFILSAPSLILQKIREVWIFLSYIQIMLAILGKLETKSARNVWGERVTRLIRRVYGFLFL